MELRDYQHKLHDDINYAWRQGHRNVAACLPTGGGKTVTFSHIVKEERASSIVLAHRAELVGQMSLALARESVQHSIIGPSGLIRLCINEHVKELGRSFYSPNAKTAAASVQTVVNYKDPYGFFNQVALWVQDECHHLLADNQFGHAIARFPNARGLGVSATPGRTDGKGLGRHADGVMDVLIMGPTPGELIARGYLSKYKIIAPPSTLNRSTVSVTPSGDFSPVELREATKRSTVLGDTVAHYIKWAFGKSGLTFADSIENATEIAARFRTSGISAEVLTGKTPGSLRAEIVGRFKAKQLLQIVSVALIDEGFDCPGVEVVSDAAATESFNRYAQRFGRGLRVMAGKDYMIYLDHVGNVERHKLPDTPRHWTLDRRDKRAKKKDDSMPLRICINVECMQPYERIYKCCPYCGTYPPEPASRSSPDFVDGDLIELDAATLANMRGEINRINAPPLFPQNADPITVAAIKRRHWERQQSQQSLRNIMAWWAGLQNSKGHSDSECYRKFYFKFSIDVASAQTLGSKDANELADRIKVELDKYGIDGSVNNALYSLSNQ